MVLIRLDFRKITLAIVLRTRWRGPCKDRNKQINVLIASQEAIIINQAQDIVDLDERVMAEVM